MQRYGVDNYDQFNMDNDLYIPFSIVSVLYDHIRPSYSAILKNLLQMENNQEEESVKWSEKSLDGFMKRLSDETTSTLEKGKKLVKFEAKCLVRYLVTPSINIFGPCFFNGKYQEKCKEDQALGLLWDQFQVIFSELGSS